MQPLIVDYLKTHTFQQLEDEHGVCVRFSRDGTKCSCNYDQLLVKSGDKLAEQCRGMVIRPTEFTPSLHGDKWKETIVGNVQVLAWPMDRFYNHGDSAAALIDWTCNGLRIYEKLDGTMVVLYWDELLGKWCAGTRSVCEADLPIQAGHLEIGDATFHDLFVKALVATRAASQGEPINVLMTQPEHVTELNEELTYVFELTSQFNRIVVEYTSPSVTLLAVRHTSTGQELNIHEVNLPHVPRPKSWLLSDVEALVAFVDQAEPSKLEGAVVIDGSFRRLKVKNKSWVMASRAKDGVTSSPRNALECVIAEKVDDVASLLPGDVADKLHAMQANYVAYCASIDEAFVRLKAEADGSRKRFAELVMLSGDWTPAYFQLWTGKATSTREWIRSMYDNGKLSATILDTLLERSSTLASKTS